MSKELSETEIGHYADILRKHGVNTQQMTWGTITEIANAMHSVKNNGKKTVKVKKPKISSESIYGCAECKIDNIKNADRMCPCPRGGCEAKVIGTKVTTEQVLFHG